MSASPEALRRYLEALAVYQDRYATWKGLRSQAIGGAQARIAIDHAAFGQVSEVGLLGHFLALLLTAIVLVGAQAVIQRAKDVV
jgi:hypothetical protein